MGVATKLLKHQPGGHYKTRSPTHQHGHDGRRRQLTPAQPSIPVSFSPSPNAITSARVMATPAGLAIDETVIFLTFSLHHN